MDIYKRAYSESHYETIKLQRQIGEIQWEKGLHKEALLLLEEAYENIGFQPHDPLDFTYLLHEGLALQILQSRIKMLTQSPGTQLLHLMEADSLMVIGFALLDEFRKKFSYEEAELFFTEFGNSSL